MMLNKTFCILASFMFFGILFIPETSYACNCDLPRTDRSLKQQVIEARKRSEAVFTGTVLEISKRPGDLYITVKFKVEEVWRGPRGAETSVFTGIGGGDCGYKFEIGEKYLVYAYKRDDSKLETNICQRTAPLAEAGPDLKVLGKSSWRK